ncbi:hypothetical protein Hanom_Chr03g00193811 [Helianthus anomalus]
MMMTKHSCFVEMAKWRNACFVEIVQILKQLTSSCNQVLYTFHIANQTIISTYNSVCTIIRQTSKQLNNQRAINEKMECRKVELSQKTPWVTGFVKEDEENNRQNSQLHLLRHRYLSKIILFEHNVHRQLIIKKANAFDKRPDKQKYLKDLDQIIPARMSAFIGKD